MIASPHPKRFVAAAVAALLILHFAIAVGSKLHESVTSDELVHLTGGYTFWKFSDYRLHPENGILPQRWEALPTWLAGAKYPTLNQKYWSGSDSWMMGHQFFYETGEDHFPRLMAARAMVALFSVATGLLVFLWSRRLFGLPGAFVSLIFFAFCPNILAHGALATSDICMTFFMLAAVGAWWRHLHDGSAWSWILSAGVFGLACVAKFSAPLLLPMMALIALVPVFAKEPIRLFGRSFDGRGARLAAVALSAIGHAIVAWLVIWMFFGFRYSAFNPALPPAEHFIRPWEVIDLNIGWKGSVLHFLGRLHALPEAYLYGFAYVLETSQIRATFLNGEYSVTGWASFFPWAFALKTTLPLIFACVLAAILAIRRWRLAPSGTWRRDLLRLTPLIVLFSVYWIVSIASHLNIGHRHILPTYPVLFIAAGALGAWLFSNRLAARAAVLLLLAWHIGESAYVAPHFIAYFNEVAGGPEQGHRHLVDSSLDWGQDLPGLETWLQAHQRPGEPVYLSYFGTGEPDYYGIRARRLSFINGFHETESYTRLEPGLYCIGATMLEHVYSTVRGPWTLEREKEYQWLRTFEPLFDAYTQDPSKRPGLEKDLTAAKWQASWTRFDALRLARLCTYLRVRHPDATIGYSIFVYRLSAEEIARATTGTLQEWSQLLGSAVETGR